MKKLILYAVVALAISITGCNSGGGDPKGVLVNFMDALSKKDIATAKKYATKDSESMLGMMEMGMKMAPAEATKDAKFDKDNFEYGDAKIEGDKATVPVKEKKTGETTNYTLKKEDGAWKVAFDKATMTQMGTDKMKGMNNGSSGMGTDSTGGMNGTMPNDDSTTPPATDTIH